MNDIPMSSLSFKFMGLFFQFRDLLTSPTKLLEHTGIVPGWNVLDYGCGTGSYSIPAAQLVGPMGKVYAADIHPLAINEVQKKAITKGLGNIYTILTDSKTELSDASIDLVLLFYVLHDFRDPDMILEEIERVLKTGGLLAIIDHRSDRDKVVSTISHATKHLKLRKSENGKKKKILLIFSKQP
jgi:ubiquinone/menaquinone biosynthesis C-methylase UbiE